MRIWLHRISHCADVSHPLLEEGYISIGFSDFSNKEFLGKVMNGEWNFFENKFIEIWKEKKKTRYNLWRFVNEFKEGDWVLVPKWGEFSIYRLEGKPELISNIPLSSCLNDKDIYINEDSKIYIDGNMRDIGFAWKVKPVAVNISRKDVFERALISRMKIRNTNAEITDLKDIIERLVGEYKNNKLSTLHSSIIESILDNVENTIVDKLTPDKFEQLIKWYFYKIGATDVYIPSKNESGKENGADADVIATFENIKVVIYVQAKYHIGATSQWAIEQIKEYKDQKENIEDEYTYISWVISSADIFTDEAIEIAKDAKVRLIDKKGFSKMLIDIGFNNIDSAFD